MGSFQSAFGKETIQDVPAGNHKGRILEALKRHEAGLLDRPANPYKPAPLPDDNASIRRTVDAPVKAKKADHNKRTYDYYKSKGGHYYRVDYFDRILMRAHDFLGFADGIYLEDGKPPCLVQLTSASNIGTRAKKILELPAHKHWLDSGGTIEVIGWTLVSGTYQPTIRAI